MSQRSPVPYFLLSLAFWAGITTHPPMLHAQPSDVAVQEARQKMESFSGGAVQMTQSAVSGLATFVAAAPGKPIPTFMSPTDPSEKRGLKFLELYGPAFGITALDQVQVQSPQGPDELGMEHVRFQQVHHGVPVRAGEIIVHLRGAQVTAVTAKTLPDLAQVETTPKVVSQGALTAAQEVLVKHLQVADATLSAPKLEVFNQGLFEGRQAPTRLAWFIEATKVDVREWIWIDAQRGAVLLHFSQLTDARSRRIHTANNTNTLPGTLVRSEGGPITGDPDVDKAYDFSGDTYNYFFTQHGRDSYDGAGAPLTSTVHYCPSTGCPYENAFWNGTQMVYGEDFSLADDVDAHELTHAVTEKSASLAYYMQSGALNESFSDIFGETVDLLNIGGTDTAAVRWQVGEDIPGIGAIRNMMDPTLFGDPGKVSDFEFICNEPFTDLGGVHINSGVPNHAYALMVDGGAYNGQTITGIGLVKAGKIQYRTLVSYLVSTADFQANYTAVQQACTDLIGTAGITAADCAQVKKALDAVEMNSSDCSPVATPALCPAGQVPTNLFFDNLENTTSGNWANTVQTGVNHWNQCDGTPDIYCQPPAPSGSYAFWGFGYGSSGDSAVAMTRNVALPAGARLQFNHSHNFEGTSTFFDGGVIEYSTNGGVTWTDAGSLISAGAAYGGTLSSANPLGPRNAFVADSLGYTASQLNLGGLAGQNVRFRFRMGTDGSVSDLGWFIDDVRVYTCAPSRTLRINDVEKAEGNSGATAFTFTVTLSPAATSNVTVTYATANGTATVPSDYTAIPPTPLVFNPGQTSKSVTVFVKGDTVVEPNETFFVNLSGASGATIFDRQGVGTILNNDGPVLRINDVTKAEGNNGTSLFTFTVTLSPAAPSAVAVTYATANGSAVAGSDYTTTNDILLFNPGETSKTISVPVFGDAVREPNEEFVVNLLSASGATIFDRQGIGIILNDEGSLLRINDVSQAEGNSGTTLVTYSVTLSPAAASTVTVHCVTANGTAAAPSDYTAVNTLLTFLPGQTSKTCTVPVIGNTIGELNEFFSANLTNVAGPATIFDGQGIGTILNDDGPLLRIGDVIATEGNAGSKNFIVTVTLSPAAASNVTVNCVTANGTATAPSDYTAVNTPLTFLPGQTSKTCTVPVVGNTIVEPNETFFVNLSGASGATIFDGQGVGTLLNDDGPVLRITDVSRTEGNSGTTLFTFTVTLSPAAASNVTVTYATANGTATAPSDYTAIPPTPLVFSPGETSRLVTVLVRGDTIIEPNETFAVNLINAVGATIVEPDFRGLGTIVNDD